jgi:cytochrome c oxidase assembly protein subunit 15
MTTDHAARTTDYARWLHRWAVLTVCATFVLLLLGAVVTTFNVGMADPIWPTYPWHLLLASWEEPRPGFLIEHTHRLAGYLVGCCVIVLAVGLWLREPQCWVRWLGVGALVGVIIQGLLGGFRVKLNELMGDNLKLIHGCFAQVVFALFVSLALFTSRGWRAGDAVTPGARETAKLRYAALLTSALVFLQIVFGALLRHTYSTLGQRGHLLVAFGVVAGVAYLVREALERPARQRGLLAPVALLAVLVALQLLLGVEAWMARYVWMDPTRQALVRTAHVLTGALIFATSVVVALKAHWRVALGVRPATAAAPQLGGVV